MLLRIFSDYAWPFCYIGKGIVEKLGREFTFKTDYICYELRPETPVGGIRVIDLKPGAKLNEININLNRYGQPYNIYFKAYDFVPNTRTALEATEFARDNNMFDKFYDRVFKAYFNEGRDIGDMAVVLELASEIGLKQEEMKYALDNKLYAGRIEENRELARANQVIVLPTFIIKESRIVGIQPYAAFQRALSSAWRYYKDELNRLPVK